MKRSGERQSFDSSKVRRSLTLACRKRPVTEAEIDAVVRRLEQWASTQGDRGITSEEIGERIIHALHDLDSVAYVRFVSVYRSFESVEEFEVLLQEMEKAERVNVEGQRTLFEDLDGTNEPDPGAPSGGKGKRRVGT